MIEFKKTETVKKQISRIRTLTVASSIIGWLMSDRQVLEFGPYRLDIFKFEDQPTVEYEEIIAISNIIKKIRFWD